MGITSDVSSPQESSLSAAALLRLGLDLAKQPQQPGTPRPIAARDPNRPIIPLAPACMEYDQPSSIGRAAPSLTKAALQPVPVVVDHAPQTRPSLAVSYASGTCRPRQLRADLNMPHQLAVVKAVKRAEWAFALGRVHDTTKSTRTNHFIMISMLLRESQRAAFRMDPKTAAGDEYVAVLTRTAQEFLRLYDTTEGGGEDPYAMAVAALSQARLFHPTVAVSTTNELLLNKYKMMAAIRRAYASGNAFLPSE